MLHLMLCRSPGCSLHPCSPRPLSEIQCARVAHATRRDVAMLRLPRAWRGSIAALSSRVHKSWHRVLLAKLKRKGRPGCLHAVDGSHEDSGSRGQGTVGTCAAALVLRAALHHSDSSPTQEALWCVVARLMAGRHAHRRFAEAYRDAAAAVLSIRKACCHCLSERRGRF